MALDRRDANLDMIRKAEEQQAATKETVFRIDRQLAETEEIGSQTLEELRKQGSQMEDITSDLDKVSQKLDQSANLQSTFDKWAGNWWGGKKKDALKEAAAEIAGRDAEALSKVKEVFEHENFASMSRSWKPAGKCYICIGIVFTLSMRAAHTLSSHTLVMHDFSPTSPRTSPLPRPSSLFSSFYLLNLLSRLCLVQCPNGGGP